MPRTCSECGLKHPNAVRLQANDGQMGGTRGVKHCIDCGSPMQCQVSPEDDHD